MSALNDMVVWHVECIMLWISDQSTIAIHLDKENLNIVSVSVRRKEAILPGRELKSIKVPAESS